MSVYVPTTDGPFVMNTGGGKDAEQVSETSQLTRQASLSGVRADCVLVLLGRCAGCAGQGGGRRVGEPAHHQRPHRCERRRRREGLTRWALCTLYLSSGNH